jgi:hypothetical protein
MLAKCPRCGEGYYGAALTEKEPGYCGACGTLLRIYDEPPKMTARNEPKKPNFWARLMEYVTWSIDRRGLL